jgi:hypothetical protein
VLKIFKYQLPADDYFSLQVPAGSRILSVDVQHGVPCMWVLVDPTNSPVTRRFRFAETKHPIEETVEQLTFIGTFQMHEGNSVFHIFEITRR